MIQRIIIDVFGVSGLIMLGYGLYLYSPIVMFVLMGLLFVVFALMSTRGTIQINLPKKG
jgi:hypothetical protein